MTEESVVLGRHIGLEVLKAIGLGDLCKITKITIELPAENLATVSITKLLLGEEAKAFIEQLSHYRLVAQSCVADTDDPDVHTQPGTTQPQPASDY